METNYDFNKGIEVIKFIDHFKIDDKDFYIPIILGIVIGLIFIGLTVFTIRKACVSMLFMTLAFVSILLGAKISVDKSHENEIVEYTDYTIKIYNRIYSEEQLYLDYDVIQKNSDGTYIVRVQW